MKRIDFNCDMGESFGVWRMGQDAEVMPWISSASIACGMHAGDPATMQATVALARRHRVAIGAHVSLPDLQGFGRRAMAITPADLHALVIYQLGALDGFARAAGTRLRHVKAHGALYHQANADPALAEAFAGATHAVDPALRVVTQPDGALQHAAAARGLSVLREAFVDRGYGADGRLLARGTPGALLTPPQAAAQALALATRGAIIAFGGVTVPVSADTLCMHGDRDDAATLAQAIHAVLVGANIAIEASP